MKIVVSGGGTGGHIYPALALIREIKKQNSSATFLYIGTEAGLESSIVRRQNIPFETIEISGFKRKLSVDNVKTVARFLTSVKRSKEILKDFQPDVVIGTGGYVCGPVVYAASRLKIPTIIHEQNSVPGLTNKFLSKFSDKVALCFEEAKQYFPKEKVVLTGNPRASEVIGFQCNYEKFDLQADLPTVLIFGGSRGARPINDTVVKSLKSFQNKEYQLVYVTGEIHYEAVKKEAQKLGNLNNVIIKPFIHNLPEVLACVDLVVSRSGATTLAEITSLGLPSILIPSPYVTNNHQEKNARALSDNGAAQLLLERDLNEESLVSSIEVVLNKEKLNEMSTNAKKLGIPNASQVLYDLVKELVGKN